MMVDMCNFNVDLIEDEQEVQYCVEIVEGDQVVWLLQDLVLQIYFQVCEKDVIGEFVVVEVDDVVWLVCVKQDYVVLVCFFDKF